LSSRVWHPATNYRSEFIAPPVGETKEKEAMNPTPILSFPSVTPVLPDLPDLTASIESLQVGMPRQHGVEGATDPRQHPWFSGFFKDPVENGKRLWLSSTGLEGDGVADTKNHGGPEKAVMVYASSHYAAWADRLDIPTLPPAAFGENLTVRGLTEETVCIGDTFAIVCDEETDPAIVQVSQPRQPCWKQERRLERPGMIAMMIDNGHTGWYFRVLREGWVGSGATLRLQERPLPQWSVARANQVRHHDKDDRDAAAELATCVLLAPSWREIFVKRLGV
jgi:MOSC domain-containing protein YiiM